MNQNIKIFLFCPIPNDQKPINEYISLKENEFTNWVTLDAKTYKNLIIKQFFWNFFILLPFIFSQFHYSLKTVGINIFLTFILLNLNHFIVFSRWNQLKNRFTTTRLFYEEASWYDGQIWEKPLELIRNDNLISTQKIEPILNRLKNTIIIFNLLTFINFLILKII